jgi:hypothetical protein
MPWRTLSSLLLLAASTAAAQESKLPVDFQRDIRPILSNHCFRCHGPAAQEGGLRLDERTAATKRAIVPGKPDEGRLVKRLTATDDDRMPPPEAGERLKPEQIAKLKAWIAQGAEYAPHWAFTKPRQAPLPKVKDKAWTRNPIDDFVLARLEKEGLKPSPEADRSTLIRRLYLDLLGLLPEPKDVEDFVNDTRPDAYAHLVEKVLQSPHYGEKQARHWLDLARYADSNGYTIDGRRSIWPYRDWVIGAFNRDLPFDQFTIEQLAGDMLPGATRDQILATGFHRNTPFNEEGGTDREQFRVERTVDRTNTTGTVWLGLSVGCAQCHNHKYDPLTQKEYYQLYAFFNQCDEPNLQMPTDEEKAKLKELQDKLAQAKNQKPGAIETKQPDAKMVAFDEVAKEAGRPWQTFEPKLFRTENGTVITGLADQSVLASGPQPAWDLYNVQGFAPEGTYTAARLEALTHDDLPKKGPGRAANGNFVMTLFELEIDGQPVTFNRAVADFTQGGFAVSDALLGKPGKGWAMGGGVGKDHQAIFIAEKPFTIKKSQPVTVYIKSGDTPKGYNVGRFRVSFTSAADKFLELPFDVQQILALAPENRTDAQKKRLSEAQNNPGEKAKMVDDPVQRVQKEIKAFEASIASSLVMRESAGRPTHVQIRGDFLQKGEQVNPGVFAVLPQIEIKDRQPNRLDLARWLVRMDNPLTARVTINRIWQQYFGKGLVDTENDFGMQGSLPTHPELLDWLAVEFMKRGWSMKAMHRLIVTSATYRQSSAMRADLHAKDPKNELLGRQFRLRLEAELIRDAALTASGLLTRKVGGPGVYPPQPLEVFSFTQAAKPWPEAKGPDRYRRGMYTYIWRQSQHPLLTTFDAPDAQTSCTRRNRSNTPLQALHIANDPTFLEFADALGKRLVKEGPRDDAGRIDFAYRLCFSRAPSVAERDRLLRFLAKEKQVNADMAWTMLSRVLLNLDEFITRE